MSPFSKVKTLAAALLFSITLLIFVTKAATPYSVSVFKWNDSEFPRVQASLKILGNSEGLMGKHLMIRENNKVNTSPVIFMPPHQLPEKIDLTVLLDTSRNTFAYKNLIRSNLKALLTYLYDKKIDVQLQLNYLNENDTFSSSKKEDILEFIDTINFSETVTPTVDGFGQLSHIAEIPAREGSQKIVLLINGTTFNDQKLDGVTGSRMKEAIKALAENKILTFFMGSPLGQFFSVPSNDAKIEIADFTHHIAGGYLGGFGFDLSSLGDLILMQGEDRFVLQYYSQYSQEVFPGAEAEFWIEGYQVKDFNYTTDLLSTLEIVHIPENQMTLGQTIPMEVSLKNYSKAINAIEMIYKNKDGIFHSLPLIHQRNSSNSQGLIYRGEFFPEDISEDHFSYYISVHTPYSSTGKSTSLMTLPVNIYDDGIILIPKLLNEKEVLWSWSGPTVEKGSKFELWSGDELLITTDKKQHLIPLNECNRYQIMQVKVIFPDGTKSFSSKPHEYYTDSNKSDSVINEKKAAELMIKCIQKKNMDHYLKLAKAVPGFNANLPLSLEKATLYFSKIITQKLPEKIETVSGYYALLHYLMNFLNKDQYFVYGLKNEPIKTSLIYKLVTKANQTLEVDEKYETALDELTSRLRGNLSL